MSVPANDWNNRLKDFISGLAGLVPKIGGILKFLLQTFWPTSYDDIWKLMEKAITDLLQTIEKVDGRFTFANIIVHKSTV